MVKELLWTEDYLRMQKIIKVKMSWYNKLKFMITNTLVIDDYLLK